MLGIIDATGKVVKAGSEIAGDQVFGRLQEAQIKRFRQQVGMRRLDIQGVENLAPLEQSAGNYRSAVYGANHLKPVRGRDQLSGASPDFFFLERAVGLLSGQDLIPLAKYDTTLPSWLEPIGKAAVQRRGHIPVPMNQSGLDNAVIPRKAVQQVIDGNNSVVIFPQGTWSETFDTELEPHVGMAALCVLLQVPVVPVYIANANNWNADEEDPAYVKFGTPILPEDFATLSTREAIEAISAEWSTQMQAMHEEYTANHITTDTEQDE